jgi:hypothetical protein
MPYFSEKVDKISKRPHLELNITKLGPQMEKGVFLSPPFSERNVKTCKC